MSTEKIRESLAQNGFDFLRTSIAEFPAKPKFAIIHFYAAVEIFLKYRLVREHWSLVVAKPEAAEWKRFVAGDFQSVTLKDAFVRLRSIVQDAPTERALDCFQKLGNHRNRLMHFYHAGLEGAPEDLAVITAELCTAWHYLHDLLTGQWKDIFKDWQKDVIEFDVVMRTNRQYLQAKYVEMEGEIKKEIENGAVFQDCFICALRAVRLKKIVGELFHGQCRVCRFYGCQLTIRCPECDEPVVLFNEGYGQCEKCESAIEPEHVAEALVNAEDEHRAIADGDDSYVRGNCSDCDGHHTLVRCEDVFVCSNCLQSYDRVENCNWCNEPNSGDMEYSYSTGCNMCEGRTGYENDE